MLGNLLLVAVVLGGIYTLMALGLTLVYGVTKVFNFAQGSFFLWGGNIAWILHKGYFQLDYELAFVITIGIMFLLGLAYEKAIIYPLRRFADWQWTAIVVTLGSALALDNLTLVIFGPRGRTLPNLVAGNFRLGDLTMPRHDVAMLLIVLAIVIGVTFFLQKTRTGMAMRGVAQDPIGADIVGIPSNRVFGYAFAITAALAGVSGMLLAPRTQLYSYVGWPVLVMALVVIVFGGLGSIKGTIFAAFALAIVEVFVTFQIGAVWALPIFLVILLIVLSIRPRGLFGTW
jgi:branched-chain amino acid transport system permease protein